MTVIGIITAKASELFHGLYIPAATFDPIYTHPLTTVDYVNLAPGRTRRPKRRAMEKALLLQGAQADSMRQIIDDNQRLSEGFSYLIQGFLGLGLFVGIAARRRHRLPHGRRATPADRHAPRHRLHAARPSPSASSWSRRSSPLLGVVSGITLGLLLANQLLTSDDFAGTGITGFYVPWIEVIGIGVFAFVASLVMTIIPSRQASSIPIAEALRYE